MVAASLDLWLYGEHVASVVERRTGKFQLRYTEQALDHWTPGRPLLSVSMPLTPSTQPPGVVGPFLEGLLPEGEARVVLEAEYGVRRGDVAGLLAQIGRDCAGAVVVVPAGEPGPAAPGVAEPLSDADLARMLRALPERPLGDDERVRVSLAGQQGKLLLARTADGGWARPVDGYPSTHILKPESGDYPDVAANEVFCLRVAQRLGLTDVDAELHDIDGMKVVVVSRYDRDDRDGTVRRLHQEDTCQALAIDVGPLGRGKYQSDGGPGFVDVARILETHNGDPQETGRLVRVAAFTVAIGNADGHGKNLSLLLPPDGRVRLASLYDVICTVHHPEVRGGIGRRDVSTELAMDVDGKTEIDTVTADDLRAEARRWHLTDEAVDHVADLLGRMPGAIEAAAAEVPGVPDELVERLLRRTASLAGGRTAA